MSDPNLAGRPLPEDLRGVLEADPVAMGQWNALPQSQKDAWLQYLTEGREPARRAIRIANLLMSITDE
ncbi:MAG TPA: YdeI/OmpD-associated family protein [Actinomycetota bacterium]|nr:YdeI/OmpD-associated family protein [Actinomycetota bacterium]